MKAPFVPIVGLDDVRYKRNTNDVSFGWFFIQLLFSLNANTNKTSNIQNVQNVQNIQNVRNVKDVQNVYYINNMNNNNNNKNSDVLQNESQYLSDVEEEKKIIMKKYQDKFNYINRVSNDVYCVFLNEEEYSELSTLKYINIFEVTKDKIVKQRFKEDEYQMKYKIKSKSKSKSKSKNKQVLESSVDIEKERNFIVRSIENWKHNLYNNHNQSKITPLGYGYYSVTNVSYHSLINDPYVLYFEPLHPIKYMNANSISFMQDSQATLGSYQKIYRGREILNNYVHSQLGITGSNQIITVMDTCIDKNHNFFYDPNEEFPMNSENMNHRKVVKYQMR